MSENNLKFYINGAWVEPTSPRTHDVINPATEEKIATIALGNAADVDKAVVAARAAFRSYSRTSPRERIALFEAIIAAYKKRIEDIAKAVTAEMGAPAGFAHSFHAASQTGLFQQFIDILKTYEFEKLQGTTAIVREPIGVCGLITPWNVPVGAIVGKLAPALAAGCTVIVKPSEIAPLSPLILAEVMHDAGVPKGVFNLVNGDGAGVGQAIAAHQDIDMVSFTGSTRAGIAVAKTAAESVKRVQQELGGKSANIILPDADLEKVVTAGLNRCYVGGGQSCQAPTRMLVPRNAQDRALAAAKAAAEAFVVGDPNDPKTTMGPVSNKAQWDKIQRLIKAGIDEGAKLVTGGTGRPDGLNRGYYVKPTVFGNVDPHSSVAQEEIFGPVLSIIPYKDEAEAIEIANDTMYGLAGWVYSATLAHAKEVALQMRTGRVYLNGAGPDPYAPFGGYKRSGNGREGGVFGLEEYLEIKALLGAAPAA
ncbi:MAG: aldehyde dehydrogenase family protein [Alphaproteobacteria bacterium]